MSQEQNPAPNVIPENTQENNENPPEVVSKEVYERIKKENDKFKSELGDMRKQIDSLKINTHKEKEDWKSIAQIHEEKAKELEQKYSGLKDSLIDEKKLAAVTAEAIKKGIDPRSIPDLELLDFEEVTVETTSTGKILVSGQDRAITKLMTLRPHWFPKNVPSVNPSTPEMGKPNGSQVTIADLNAASAQYEKTKSELDRKAYYDLIKKYKAQGG